MLNKPKDLLERLNIILDNRTTDKMLKELNILNGQIGTAQGRGKVYGKKFIVDPKVSKYRNKKKKTEWS